MRSRAAVTAATRWGRPARCSSRPGGMHPVNPATAWIVHASRISSSTVSRAASVVQKPGPRYSVKLVPASKRYGRNHPIRRPVRPGRLRYSSAHTHRSGRSPRHGSTSSYVRRLARANHLRPAYLRQYLASPKDGTIRIELLAVIAGRSPAALEHALADLGRPQGTIPHQRPRVVPDRNAARASLFTAIRRHAAEGRLSRRGRPGSSPTRACGHWLAAEIMRAWARRGSQPAGSGEGPRRPQQTPSPRQTQVQQARWTHDR
jgi:hypothetical protein